MSLRPPVRTPVADALVEALGLVFPTWCVGCDEPDVTLCGLCRAALAYVGVDRMIEGMPVRSALVFEGVPARALRAFKEDGRTSLARVLGPLLAAAAEPYRDALVVPVPSSRSAMRRRGYAPVELLARRGGLRPVRLLATARVAADQRGLSRAGRARNVAGTLRARGAEGARVLLIDDVVTTGATLHEAARALRAGGAEVLGAATLAATPSRRGAE